MKKTEMLTLIIGLIIGASTVAQAIQHIGDQRSAYRPGGEMFDGVPKWDPDELPRLQEMGDRAQVSKARKAYKKTWEAAGCEVEGFGPMDRTMCPGFRVNPKAEYEGGAQWMTLQLHKDPQFPNRWEHQPGKKKMPKPSLPDGQI